MDNLTWAEHLEMFEWRQSEHVTLVGTTGCGKTTLARAILPLRSYVVVLANKPKDSVVDQFKQDGYRVVREWGDVVPSETPRVVVWPKILPGIVETKSHHREVFRQVLQDVYHVGGWALYVDELQYMTQSLRLETEMSELWQMARASGVSIVGGNQRPRNIPLVAYSQATHLYVWGNRDTQDVKRIASISGHVDPKEIEYTLKRLPSKHHFLYIAQSGEMHVSVLDPAKMDTKARSR